MNLVIHKIELPSKRGESKVMIGDVKYPMKQGIQEHVNHKDPDAIGISYVVWVAVDPNSKPTEHTIRTYHTGESFNVTELYLGTTIYDNYELHHFLV